MQNSWMLAIWCIFIATAKTNCSMNVIIIVDVVVVVAIVAAAVTASRQSGFQSTCTLTD